MKIKILFSLLMVFGLSHAQKKETDSLNNIQLYPVIIENITDYASPEIAPVSINHINAQEIKIKSGNLSLPSLLLGLPSVYTTKQGGGYGDDRINIRGFDQRYIAVLINGVPVNDMISGWVYWSNWMNLTDIASSVQMQKGLSTVKLSVPAVGGSINIYTKSVDKIKGGLLSYNYGSEGFHKFEAGYNTGIMENGVGASVLLGYYYGNGFVDQTQGEGYNYFINLDYEANDKHRFMFTLFGGPQWHNQHNNASPLIDYLTYGGDFETPNIKYNSEWGILQGKAYTWSRNYFHKPVAILNWDYQMNDSFKLTTALYGAWGRGGGSGPIGAINYNYPGSPLFIGEDGQVRFDDIYTWNSGGHVPDFGPDRVSDVNGLYINNISTGLTRFAFMNNHSWYGSVINVSKKLFNMLSLNLGLDGRWTRSKSTLAVNDVLGADAYYDNFDSNHPDRIIFPDEFVEIKPDWNPFKSIEDLSKIVFYNGSNINWLGSYAQLNYEDKNMKGFLQGSLNKQWFQRVDYFNLPPDQQKSEWISVPGGNIKAGLSYFINNRHSLYGNGGYFSKQPLFDAIFPNWDNTPSDDIRNEKIKSIELGYRFKNEYLRFRLGLYQTQWKDRFEMAKDFINNQQVSGRMYNVEEVHRGLETEASIKLGLWKIKSMLSLGDWKYNNDIKGVKLYNFQRQLVAEKDYYLKNVKVGDAPQFTASYSIYFTPVSKFNLYAEQIFIDKLYAKIDADSFSDPNHKGSLELPSYSLVNAGASYQMTVKNIGDLLLTFNFRNLMNKSYISESHTNYFPDQNSINWNGVNTQNRVFFGWGRTFDLGVSIKF